MLRRGPRFLNARGGTGETDDLPLPRASLHYRLQAWRDFQRALDPLAAPKPLRRPQKR